MCEIYRSRSDACAASGTAIVFHIWPSGSVGFLTSGDRLAGHPLSEKQVCAHGLDLMIVSEAKDQVATAVNRSYAVGPDFHGMGGSACSASHMCTRTWLLNRRTAGQARVVGDRFPGMERIGPLAMIHGQE